VTARDHIHPGTGSALERHPAQEATLVECGSRMAAMFEAASFVCGRVFEEEIDAEEAEVEERAIGIGSRRSPPLFCWRNVARAWSRNNRVLGQRSRPRSEPCG
jgi:hypothetical protein